jgi:hypothetical protein
LASVPGVAWANDCRRLGRECRRDSQCCSRNCIRRGDDKVCGCPTGQRRCNDRCVNLKRNENHCGSCFNRCAEGQECVSGVCQGGGCPSGTTLCGGNCVLTDCPSSGQTLNPSTCKCECPAGQTCCNGACRNLICGPNEGSLNLGTCQCEPCPESDQVLCNGMCVNNVCGRDKVFNYTTCQCETVTCVQCGANPQDCGRGLFPRCGTSSGGFRCDCLRKVEGVGCSCVFITGAEMQFCTRDTDCPTGKICVDVGSTPTPCEGVCADPCPNPGC